MQTSTKLVGRTGGLAVVVGGLLWAVGGTTALNTENLGISMTGPHLVLTAGGILTLIGLAGLGSLRAGHHGRAGVTGVFVAGAGVALVIASKNVPSSVSDDVAFAVFYAGGLLLVVGSLLAGIVDLYRRAWALGTPLVTIGVLAVLQVILMMGPFETTYLSTVVLPILIGLAWAVLGYSLWSYEASAGRFRRSQFNDDEALDAAVDEATESLPARS